MLLSRSFNLPPVEVQVPASQEQENEVTATESNQNAQISPPRIKADRKGLIELIANTVCTVRAIRSRIVSNVSCTTARKERLHVVAAGLPWGCREQVQLAGCTPDRLSVEFCGYKTGDEAGEAGAEFRSVSGMWRDVFGEIRGLTGRARIAMHARNREWLVWESETDVSTA